MTDEERQAIKDEEKKKIERRKVIWDKMTPEEQQAAEEKKEELIECSVKEEKKIMEKLKQEGRLKGGLDGYYPEIVEHHREYRQRLHDMLVFTFGEEA